MKTNLKRASLLVSGLLVGTKLFAQQADTSKTASNYVQPFAPGNAYRTWSIGVNGGVLTPFNIFSNNSKAPFTSPNGNLGYGVDIKYQATPAVGFQVDYLGGKLTGDDSHADAQGISPYSSFSTEVHYAVSASANITLGDISWRYNQSGIQPYITTGVGTMNYTPELTTPGGTTFDFKSTGNGAVNEIYWPVGVGLKFNVARGINVDLGYQVNFMFSNNLEGYPYDATNSKFSYAHLGLEFALGSKSKPQLATHNPVSSMRQEYMWQNQQTRVELEAQLAQQRAQNDQLKSQLDAANANFAKLTMDSDGDGVSDFFDKCPGTPAGTKVDGSGCPLPTPTIVATPPTKVYITEEDKKVVSEAVRNLDFDFNKTTIKAVSYPSLDRLADLLSTKHFNLKLAGYTDNVGSQAYNLKLSRGRAQAVKDYLIGKGVNESQIQADGFGKSNPIASNKTAAGRAQNRRVEFTLF
jgi:OOP family OmpA-OmpF porin